MHLGLVEKLHVLSLFVPQGLYLDGLRGQTTISTF